MTMVEMLDPQQHAAHPDRGDDGPRRTPTPRPDDPLRRVVQVLPLSRDPERADVHLAAQVPVAQDEPILGVTMIFSGMSRGMAELVARLLHDHLALCDVGVGDQSMALQLGEDPAAVICQTVRRINGPVVQPAVGPVTNADLSSTR